jgi:hypothetical protein
LLGAVEHAIYGCRDAPGGVIHHRDRGRQYRSDALYRSAGTSIAVSVCTSIGVSV